MSRVPRLMLAIGTLGDGGSERQITEFAVRVPRDRYEPVVVANLGDDGLTRHAQTILDAGIPLFTVREGEGGAVHRATRLGRQYAGAVRAVRPDVVYAWLDETGAFLAPICRARRIPCLVARRNIMGSRLEHQYPRLRPLLLKAEQQALLVTANSGAVARMCVTRGFSPSRVLVTPNGHETVQPLPPPPEGPITFGYVARFRREKGHHRLLDALERMPRGDWRVDLAGDGPLQPEIEQRISRLGLDDRVRLLGVVADVREFWRSRHIGLLLSDTEGLPNAVLEAAYAGRPVVATRAGGTPEVVGDGGILVPLDDPDQTAAAMHSLVVSEPDRRRLGESIWRHVSETFSMTRMVDAHLEAIGRVAPRHRMIHGISQGG